MSQADIEKLCEQHPGKRYTIKDLAAELKVSPSCAASSVAKCVKKGTVKKVTLPVDYFFVGLPKYYAKIDKGGKVDKDGQKSRRADRASQGQGPLYRRIQGAEGDSR